MTKTFVSAAHTSDIKILWLLAYCQGLIQQLKNQKEKFVNCHRKGKVYSGTYLSGANAMQSSISNLESPVTKCFIPIKFTS